MILSELHGRSSLIVSSSGLGIEAKCTESDRTVLDNKHYQRSNQYDPGHPVRAGPKRRSCLLIAVEYEHAAPLPVIRMHTTQST